EACTSGLTRRIAPAFMRARQYTPTPVESAREGGAVSRASASQKMAVGRVLGSKYSSRGPPGVLSAAPPRFWAEVAAVTTLKMGGWGACRRGLMGGRPSGY